MRALIGKTVAITGSSRGIGRALALRCARQGANVALLSRSVDQPAHPKLTSTMMEVARLVRDRYGTEALVVPIDLATVTAPESIAVALEQIEGTFGRLDALVLNASAISVDKRPAVKQYDQMMNLNVRSSYQLIAQSELLLGRSELRHVLSISPPLRTLHSRWLTPHPVYTASKYAMSMVTLGCAGHLRCNTLWPAKLIRTAATAMLEERTGVPGFSRGRPPNDFADVACSIISSERSGESLLDEDVVPVVDPSAVDDIFI